MQVGKVSGGDMAVASLTRVRTLRQYSLAYKRQAVDTYDSLLIPGEKGAYLLKVGIQNS